MLVVKGVMCGRMLQTLRLFTLLAGLVMLMVVIGACESEKKDAPPTPVFNSYMPQLFDGEEVDVSLRRGKHTCSLYPCKFRACPALLRMQCVHEIHGL